MNNVFLGIDPGLHGAIAKWFKDENELFIYDMPTTKIRGKLRVDEDALLLLLGNELIGVDVVTIEKVGAMPQQGVGSTATFMRHAGILVGACRMAAMMNGNLVVNEVTPATWKAACGLVLPAGSTLKARKDASRMLARRLFPEDGSMFLRAKDDGRAEAALLARHGSRAVSSNAG